MLGNLASGALRKSSVVVSLDRAEDLKPFLKWAGGKRWLARVVARLIPENIRVYREPFLGSGAVYLKVLPRRSVLSDSNAELMNAYRVIKDSVDELIRKLKTFSTDEATYYRVRASSPRSRVAKAARFIYLNKTCWNGLYRVNRDGEFNVPYGYYDNRRVYDSLNLRAVSRVLKHAKLVQADFQEALQDAEAGDVVFLDPPYRTVKNGQIFNRYTPAFFTDRDLRRLAGVCEELHDRGCHILMTHLVTKEIRELFAYLSVRTLRNRWDMSRNGSFRRVVEEGLYSNVPSTRGW